MNFINTYDELTALWECKQVKLTEGIPAELRITESEETLTEAKADELKLIDFAGEDLAFRFLKIRNRLKAPENDLYYWIKNKTVDDLETTVSELESTKTKSQAKKEIEAGAELVGENEYWKVYHITTFEASQKYGRDTKWCITGIKNYGNKYWKQYTRKGIKFYFYITKGKYDPRGQDSKIAVAMTNAGDYEIYDQQDHRINYIPNTPKIPGLPYFESVEEYIYEGGRLPEQINPIKIIVADTVKVIDNSAFKNCNSLVSVTISDSVTSIGDDAFRECKNLKSVIIPDSVTSIGSAAFGFCDSLTSVVIGDNVTSISDHAFNGCDSLTSITIGSGVESIGEKTFGFCNSLVSVTIPDSVTSIGDNAFYHCTCLTSVTIPDSVTSIGKYAFAYCDNLTSVTIGNSVKSIGWGTFEDCKNLKSVIIPDSVTSIDGLAFCGCINLKSITIPDSVTSIRDQAFAYCDSLTIYCEAFKKPEGWSSMWHALRWTASSRQCRVVWKHKKNNQQE